MIVGLVLLICLVIWLGLDSVVKGREATAAQRRVLELARENAQRQEELERALQAPKLAACAVATAERPVWEQSDAAAWRAFLGTTAGRKLAGILRFDEQTQNRSAVLRVENHPYNCGFAAGFHARSESLLALSADVRPQQDDHSDAGAGATPLAERMAP